MEMSFAPRPFVSEMQLLMSIHNEYQACINHIPTAPAGDTSARMHRPITADSDVIDGALTHYLKCIKMITNPCDCRMTHEYYNSAVEVLEVVALIGVLHCF